MERPTKLIRINQDTYITLYRMITTERLRLLKLGRPNNLSFNDIVQQLITEVKENGKYKRD